MTSRQRHAIDQHDSCCKLLGLPLIAGAAWNTTPSLSEQVSELIQERNRLMEALAKATEKCDSALLDAVKQGVAAAPDRTLTDEVIGAFRLPMPLHRFTHIAHCFPKDSCFTQRGPWFLITTPTNTPS